MRHNRSNNPFRTLDSRAGRRRNDLLVYAIRCEQLTDQQANGRTNGRPTSSLVSLYGLSCHWHWLGLDTCLCAGLLLGRCSGSTSVTCTILRRSFELVSVAVLLYDGRWTVPLSGTAPPPLGQRAISKVVEWQCPWKRRQRCRFVRIDENSKYRWRLDFVRNTRMT